MTYTIEQIRRATDSACICDRTDYERMRKLNKPRQLTQVQTSREVFHSCAILEPPRSNYFEDRRCD